MIGDGSASAIHSLKTGHNFVFFEIFLKSFINYRQINFPQGVQQRLERWICSLRQPFFPIKIKSIRASPFDFFHERKSCFHTHTFFHLFTDNLKFTRTIFWIFCRFVFLFHGMHIAKFSKFSQKCSFLPWQKKSTSPKFIERVFFFLHANPF